MPPIRSAIRKIHTSLVKASKESRLLHWIVRLDEKRLKRTYAKRLSRTHMNHKAVFFESYSGASYACSPKSIYQELCSTPYFDDWIFYWSFTKRGQPLLDESPEVGRAIIVRPGTDEYYAALATSKYWVRNNRVAPFIQKRPDQIYVQTWHGTPLKALGYDVGTIDNGSFASGLELARQNHNDSLKWNWFLSPSSFASNCFARAFSIDGAQAQQVFIQNCYPRNDALALAPQNTSADPRVAPLKKRLCLPAHKKVLLYAPTWRDDQKRDEGGYYLDMMLDLDTLAQEISDEWILLVRLHTLVKNRYDLHKYRGFAFDVSDVNDINDLYLVADALCTDYSSVFFDFAYTKRPLLFFWPDYDHYRSELHDFYIDIDEIPGPKCTTTEQLVTELKSLDSWDERYRTSYASFQDQFCPPSNGHAAKQVIDLVFSLKGNS